VTAAHPDFSGTYRANLEASKFLGAKPLALDVAIEHRDPKLIQSIISTTAAGEERMVYTFTTDGADSVNTIRGTDAHTRAHWEGSELVIESWMNAGGREFRFRDFWSLSEDGKTLTMAHRDDDLAGQISVLERIR